MRQGGCNEPQPRRLNVAAVHQKRAQLWKSTAKAGASAMLTLIAPPDVTGYEIKTGLFYGYAALPGEGKAPKRP
jgi:hypothetical protein